MTDSENEEHEEDFVPSPYSRASLVAIEVDVGDAVRKKRAQQGPDSIEIFSVWISAWNTEASDFILTMWHVLISPETVYKVAGYKVKSIIK